MAKSWGFCSLFSHWECVQLYGQYITRVRNSSDQWGATGQALVSCHVLLLTAWEVTLDEAKRRPNFTASHMTQNSSLNLFKIAQCTPGLCCRGMVTLTYSIVILSVVIRLWVLSKKKKKETKWVDTWQCKVSHQWPIIPERDFCKPSGHFTSSHKSECH